MKFTSSHTTMALLLALGLSSPSIVPAASGSQTMRDKLQTTIGGADYFVTGEVVNVQGDVYTVETSGGETVQLQTSADTNMFCQSQSERATSQQTSLSAQRSSSGMSSSQGMGMNNQSSQISSSESSIGVSEKQAQSQEAKSGTQSKGFRIGDCPFQIGDMVKAEVTDQGTVSFMRSVDRRQSQTARAWQDRERNEAKGSGRSTHDMGLPQEYIFLPAGALGSMQISQDTEQYNVNTSDGENVGQVYRVIINAQGDPAYVIIRMKEDNQLKPVPWQAIQVSPETQSVTLVVSRSQMDQLPGYNADDMTMQNIRTYWEMAEAEKDRRASRQARYDQGGRSSQDYDRRFNDPYDARENRYGEDEWDGQDRRMSNRQRNSYTSERSARPGEAGEPGIESIFGSPSTLPPGEYSPGYTGADRSGYQGDDFRRSDQGRFERGDRQRYSDRDRYARSFRSQPDHDWYKRRDRFDGDHQSDYSDNFRNQRDQSRYGRENRQRYSDRDQQGQFSSQREEYDQYQSRRSRSGHPSYDDRPEPYRP